MQCSWTPVTRRLFSPAILVANLLDPHALTAFPTQDLMNGNRPELFHFKAGNTTRSQVGKFVAHAIMEPDRAVLECLSASVGSCGPSSGAALFPASGSHCNSRNLGVTESGNPLQPPACRRRTLLSRLLPSVILLRGPAAPTAATSTAQSAPSRDSCKQDGGHPIYVGRMRGSLLVLLPRNLPFNGGPCS